MSLIFIYFAPIKKSWEKIYVHLELTLKLCPTLFYSMAQKGASLSLFNPLIARITIDGFCTPSSPLAGQRTEETTVLRTAYPHEILPSLLGREESDSL